MQLWLHFWIFLFWGAIFGFLINFSNFLFIFFFSELVWIILYCYSLLIGLYIDNLTVLAISFFILGFAGLEFAIGFLLIILFKVNNKSMQFETNTNLNSNYLKTEINKYYIENFLWLK